METRICIHKQCPFQGEPQPIVMFNVDRQRTDGRSPYCRTCRTRISRDRMERDPEARQKAAAANARYRQKPESKERANEYYLAHKPEYRAREREYAKRPDVRERLRRKQAAYRERNEGKECARHAISLALRGHRMTKPATCAWCGAAAHADELEAHHWLGYEPEYWLDVKFVHAACHLTCESALLSDWPR